VRLAEWPHSSATRTSSKVIHLFPVAPNQRYQLDAPDRPAAISEDRVLRVSESAPRIAES
jgi:hypothetical protein